MSDWLAMCLATVREVCSVPITPKSANSQESLDIQIQVEHTLLFGLLFDEEELRADGVGWKRKRARAKTLLSIKPSLPKHFTRV